MAHDPQLESLAQLALEAMRSAGFGEAQVTASRAELDELNIADNEPALLRSTESRKLALLGIADGRVASTELTELTPQAVRDRAAALFADAQAAPQDPANAVSSGQNARIVKGPQQGDQAMLADAVRGLLDFRKKETPAFVLSEGEAAYRLNETRTLTTGGSDIAVKLGWYSLSGFGTAREGTESSSFNFAGGRADSLAGAPPQELFGLGQMMRDTCRQVRTKPLGDKFVGDVVLMPNAVEDLLGWLLGQLGDTQLIAGSSLYKEKVGQQIGSKLFTLRSSFEGPGVAPVSSDAFLTPPITVVDQGVLTSVLPTLYGSRKTKLPHVPTTGGWEIAAGTTPLAEMVGDVKRGALVGRLSMGMPAANGNFSGVIKNSFAINGGEVGAALAETMIAGNMAQMLLDVVAASREVLDGGAARLPWLRIANLHFS